MWTANTSEKKQSTDYSFRRVTIDLSSGNSPQELVPYRDLIYATQRANLRGLILERRQGTTLDDYALPERVYTRNPNVKLLHFITPEFWQELRQRVFTAFDGQIVHYGLQ